MLKSFLFSFAVVYCVDVYIISAEEVSANDVAIDQPEISDFISVDTADVDGSELEVARTDECKCKNGKCMRRCDIDKIYPCDDKPKVCVCDPEFAEIEPGVCKFCDCGIGFNCTFRKFHFPLQRICYCPKGYYYGDHNDKCIMKCSKERPCKNGGSCLYEECKCSEGTSGELCEEILDCSHCVNRLEADCLYDPHKSKSYCSCKNSSLYYDYSRDICIPCPCEGGLCVQEYDSIDLKCSCYSGYNEFNGYCKVCDCGLASDYCYFDNDGNKRCNCKEGYFEREGYCRSCDCDGLHINKCEVTGNEKRCFCDEGFHQFLDHCEDIDECETNNTCHPTAKCNNLFGSFECLCPDGYRGYLVHGSKVQPGDECFDIDECTEKFDACFYTRYTWCVNVPGSYKCECRTGYEPYSYKVPPHETSCVPTSKSWGPALIVMFTTCALIGVLYFTHAHLKKRAARSN